MVVFLHRNFETKRIQKKTWNKIKRVPDRQLIRRKIDFSRDEEKIFESGMEFLIIFWIVLIAKTVEASVLPSATDTTSLTTVPCSDCGTSSISACTLLLIYYIIIKLNCIILKGGEEIGKRAKCLLDSLIKNYDFGADFLINGFTYSSVDLQKICDTAIETLKTLIEKYKCGLIALIDALLFQILGI